MSTPSTTRKLRHSFRLSIPVTAATSDLPVDCQVSTRLSALVPSPQSLAPLTVIQITVSKNSPIFGAQSKETIQLGRFFFLLRFQFCPVFPVFIPPYHKNPAPPGKKCQSNAGFFVSAVAGSTAS